MAQDTLDQLAAGLRRAKRRLALLVALADLGGAWDLMQVTSALTRFADGAVETGLRAILGAEIARGRLPGIAPGSDPSALGMVVMAMGKMGARELNYSSDIDLICLFDESRFAPADVHAARSGFIRATRRLTRLLSENTAEGYVLRTDLRLRPDAAVTPVCIGMDAAEEYYESQGRTWERAAWIKARPAAGDIGAGEAFIERLRPFVWRKHLDFAAIEDAHDMRLRIRSHKRLHPGQGGAITLEGHDLKLGAGGIREIEFFTQRPDPRPAENARACAKRSARGSPRCMSVRKASSRHRSPPILHPISAQRRRRSWRNGRVIRRCAQRAPRRSSSACARKS